jgi:KUP system potassium uptake protein
MSKTRSARRGFAWQARGQRRGTRFPHAGATSLTVSALGVVFGAIGTSPLYAIDQIFFGPAAVAPTPENALGAISLAIWTITLVGAVTYALLMLRAENDGEGGVFALYGLLHKYRFQGARVLLWALMLGAGLLFGDGIITPAISVLSAVEGLEVAAPAFQPYVALLTIAILSALFAIQLKWASRVGVIFGPVVILWFAVIAGFGLAEILRTPEILAAFNPLHGLAFLVHSGPRETLWILSALILVVTGGEAMYADLGHFGAKPIRIAWFAVVFPALLLNYLGQGAHLLSGAPIPGYKLFFSLIPTPLLFPVILLATLATVSASQALISGTFSLAWQAIGIGLAPRIEVQHTHHAHAGQIYIPAVNWGLYAGCVALVVAFGSSTAIAAAYGLAVAGVMLITSVAMIMVARRYWRWSKIRTALAWGPLTFVNGAFLVASSMKFFEGGFVPFTVGVVVFLCMATWRWGRKATFAAYAARSNLTMGDVVDLHRSCGSFVERNALVMAPTAVRRFTDRAPALLGLLWDRYGVFPRNLVVVEVVHPKVPYIHDNRYHVTVFDRDRSRGCVIGVELRFGFMEEPNVERYLADMARHHEIDLPADPHKWVVHVAHENLLPAKDMNFFKMLRFRLFLFLRLISRPAYYGYGLGDEVQLSAEILPVRVR